MIRELIKNIKILNKKVIPLSLEERAILRLIVDSGITTIPYLLKNVNLGKKTIYASLRSLGYRQFIYRLVEPEYSEYMYGATAEGIKEVEEINGK